VEASLHFHVFKKVLQRYFILYDKTRTSEIVSFTSMINQLKNLSSMEFKSYQANLEKVKKQHHRATVNAYSKDCDDYIIAGNAFLTLLRAQVFKLDFKAE